MATAVGMTQIGLSCSDNAADETGSKVERSPDGTSGWAQIGTTAANATTYADATVTCGTAYYYRIRATNTTGDSANSNTATATTAACVATYAISGYVRQGTKRLTGVVLAGFTGNPTSNANGFYSATVTQGWAGNVTPTKTGSRFSPGTVSYADVTRNIRADFSAQRAKQGGGLSCPLLRPETSSHPVFAPTKVPLESDFAAIHFAPVSL